MRLFAVVLVLVFAFGLPTFATLPAASGPSVLTSNLMSRMQKLVAEHGVDREMPPKFANALGVSDTGKIWSNREIAAKAGLGEAGELLHWFSVSRGGDKDLVLSRQRANTLLAFRANRDGSVVAAFTRDVSSGRVTMRSPAEAQADLDSELMFWDQNEEPISQWNLCLGELGGAHPVTAEEKLKSCTARIESGKETPRAVALAYVGRSNAHVEDTSKQLQDLEQSVKTDPTYAVAWAQLCSAHMGLSHDHKRAMQDCTKAITLDPKASEGWTFRGDISLYLRAYDRAIEDYNHAIKLQPTWMWPWDNRGEAFLRLNQFDRAIHDFTEVIRLSPNYAMGYLDRGIARMRKNELDAARADFEAGMKVDPKSASCLLGLGLVKRSRGDVVAGNADIAAAKAISPRAADNFVKDGIPVP